MLRPTWVGIALVLAAAVLGVTPKGLVPQGRAADGGVVVGSPVLTRTEASAVVRPGRRHRHSRRRACPPDRRDMRRVVLR